jgi:Listeria-Bacteroides repeat domain (List_Bact_rpt).
MSFEATFAVISTTVTLDANYDEAPTPATITATYGESVTLGKPAARAESRFAGWAIVTGVDEDTGDNILTVVTNNQGVPTGNVVGLWEDNLWALDKTVTPFTLYAVWEPNVYNIKILYGEEGAGTITFPTEVATATTYKYDGVTLNGFGASGLAYNTTVTVATPTSNAGREFLKWVDVYGASGAIADLPAVDVSNGITLNDEDVYLVAVWDYIDVTITKVAQVGEIDSPTQVVKYGQSFNLGVLVPTDPHHTFGGWVFDLGASPLVYAADSTGECVTAVTADVTVYAYWAPVQYEIKATNRTIDESNAVITENDVVLVNYGGTINLVASQRFDYGYSITAKANAKSGYSFLGWYTVDAQGELSETAVSVDANYTFTVTGARSLCAQFKVNQYTISFSGTDYVDITLRRRYRSIMAKISFFLSSRR